MKSASIITPISSNHLGFLPLYAHQIKKFYKRYKLEVIVITLIDKYIIEKYLGFLRNNLIVLGSTLSINDRRVIGINSAKNDVIFFFDVDDIQLPNRIENGLSLLEKNSFICPKNFFMIDTETGSYFKFTGMSEAGVCFNQNDYVGRSFNTSNTEGDFFKGMKQIVSNDLVQLKHKENTVSNKNGLYYRDPELLDEYEKTFINKLYKKPLISLCIPMKDYKWFNWTCHQIEKMTENLSCEVILTTDFEILPETIPKFNGNECIIIPCRENIGVKRNLMNKIAKGKFIAQADSDDYYFPERLLKQINHLIVCKKEISTVNEFVCYNVFKEQFFFMRNSWSEAMLLYTREYANKHSFGSSSNREGNDFTQGSEIALMNETVLFVAFSHDKNTVKRTSTDYFSLDQIGFDSFEKSFLNKTFNSTLK